MDSEARGFPRENIRVSDAERDTALAELSEHFQAGRLTQDEFDERSGLALRARTGGDLNSLFGDLPARPSAPAARIPGPSAPLPSPVMPPEPRPGGGWLLPTARAAFVLAILATVASGAVGPHHGHYIGWLIPVLVIGLIFLRVLRARR